MRAKHATLLSCSILILLFISSPGVTLAGQLTVSQSCGSVPNCYTSISAAVSAASTTTSPSIVIEPGTYTDSVTLTGNVPIPIAGTETARTVLQSAGGPAITVNGLSTVNISKLTIASTSVGILVTGVTSATISNNIFFGSGQGTAIEFQGASSGVTISNNTFLLNQTAISAPPTGTVIQSNIFSQNTIALSAQPTSVTNNDFDRNTTNGYTFMPTGETNLPNSITSVTDPKFVNPNSSPPSMDLHLQQGSPCIGNGFNGTDIGAYGGNGADTIPFIISGVALSSPGSGSVSVSWSPNIAYNIGGYNVYYSLNRSGAPYDNKATQASSATSTVISGLTTTVEPISKPALNNLGIGNGTLFVSWSAVPSATDYHLHYTDTSIISSPTITIDVKNTTSYALGGLINGHYYLITVSALAQNTYFFAVTAFDNTNTVVSAGGGTPGVSDESNYSTEQSILLGSTVEGPLSDPKTDFPEAIIANPDLVNSGCFIATAAYGHYSASQVQALREFRERYLLTNAPGRAFVRWYYRYGPGGAEFINAHPWLKPAVRVALMPAVGCALFMTRASALVKTVALVSAGLLILSLLARKKLLHAGGRR